MDRNTGGGKRSQMMNQSGGKSKDRSTANSKSIGLTDELIEQIKEHEGLEQLIKLHELNKKVNSKLNDNQDKIDKLRLAFQHLGDKVKEVLKEQNTKSTVTPALEKGKKDGKKGK